MEEQIKYVVERVEEITHFNDFGAYLTLILELDAFVLNDDRHYRNISILKDGSEFKLAPIFDNGGAFLSDEYSYAGSDVEYLTGQAEAKPFSYDFDEQLDAAEKLYGVQIEFPRDAKFLKKLETEVLRYYTREQLGRVEAVLRNSIRKYQYLATNKYEDTSEMELF